MHQQCIEVNFTQQVFIGMFFLKTLTPWRDANLGLTFLSRYVHCHCATTGPSSFLFIKVASDFITLKRDKLLTLRRPFQELALHDIYYQRDQINL
jgi:hypothetical protein